MASIMQHTTVCVNKYTLRYQDGDLEQSYQAFCHSRQKALWLRGLIPAAISHLVFAISDSVEHDPLNLQVTIPARLFLVVLQIGLHILVKMDLVKTDERLMFMVAMCNGLSTLLMYALQRSVLHQWDVLFVLFGLSFYTIPKVTPLGFVHTAIGSWTTAVVYFYVAVFLRPSTLQLETVLSFFYCAPVIWIFNTISYYSEYNARERFVLRKRLNSERISLAVSRTLLEANKTRATLSCPQATMTVDMNGTTLFLGVLLWGAFTLGSFASFPDMFKFVDEATGWAWFSHCAGVTVFLVMTTRRLTMLAVVPCIGALLLWVMSLVMSAEWIVFSAHSVGYTLLAASAMIALGVVSRFVLAWRQLVGFLQRTCFLYPQLQDGLNREFPLLEKIVSEYNAGFEPHILASRNAVKSPTHTHTTISPGSEASTHMVEAETTSGCGISSVLPSFKDGKCFFCSKNDVVHYVPACGMWGKWAHWRMDSNQMVDQAQKGNIQQLSVKPTVSMCTSYYDLQAKAADAVDELGVLTHQLEITKAQLVAATRDTTAAHVSNALLRHALHDASAKHDADVTLLSKEANKKLTLLQQESNERLHEFKAEQARSIDTLKARLAATMAAHDAELEAATSDAKKALRLSCDRIAYLEARVGQLEVESRTANAMVPALVPSHSSLVVEKQSRRMPYARALEIEGLRESVKH
ncbi:hypothetical protein, variant [Saprolegnia diclina VS20]|uniref:Transmembrane protein n=1 Tax=Saprolegnia diclina (strain VS20) TaxID=1156394 RepID=T0Q429_SAPDV|nr:hypothetical protein, variant [Saprolegnia diclina VS20]EQC32584.1 hypothetical protein, variant [Saprolegnia diclina VS20]|eukprot:XP_008614085.1 hypothetical protein, variant [Saprolegnia diclina VS20]